MIILTHKNFDKSFRKIPAKIKAKFYERMDIFILDEFDFRLRNHPLSGEYKGSRSIDITGDWRVLYERKNEQAVLLIDIGTHSQLYG